MATVCLDKSSAKIACLIFSILLGLVSGFDMPDKVPVWIHKVESTCGLLPPVSVVVCMFICRDFSLQDEDPLIGAFWEYAPQPVMVASD